MGPTKLGCQQLSHVCRRLCAGKAVAALSLTHAPALAALVGASRICLATRVPQCYSWSDIAGASILAGRRDRSCTASLLKPQTLHLQKK